jgi:hypothetical protein
MSVCLLVCFSCTFQSGGVNQPRRACAACGEGFAVDADLRTHTEKGCMGRAAVLGWVSRDTLAPSIAQLVARVGNMPATKSFSRKYKVEWT